MKINSGIEPVKNTEIVVVKVEISYLFPNTIMENSAETKNAVTAIMLQTIPLISDAKPCQRQTKTSRRELYSWGHRCSSAILASFPKTFS